LSGLVGEKSLAKPDDFYNQTATNKSLREIAGFCFWAAAPAQKINQT
jgi:hypothetical protein